MHFSFELVKWPKDFLAQTIDSNLIAVKVFNPILTGLIKENIKHKFLEEKLQTVMASSVTNLWLEDNFLTLSLFGQNDSFLIQDAQAIPNNLNDFFLGQDWQINDRKLVLLFGEETALFKGLKKDSNWQTIELLSPKFWQNKELIQFLAMGLSIELAPNLIHAIEKNISPSVENYLDILLIMKSYTVLSDGPLELQIVEHLFKSTYVDKFLLAETLNNKQLKIFWEKINVLQDDFDTSREVFSFMQGHLLKIYDPSFIQNKEKVSAYDKKILEASKRFSKDELDQLIDEFRQREQMAKLKIRPQKRLMAKK